MHEIPPSTDTGPRSKISRDAIERHHKAYLARRMREFGISADEHEAFSADLSIALAGQSGHAQTMPPAADDADRPAWRVYARLGVACVIGAGIGYILAAAGPGLLAGSWPANIAAELARTSLTHAPAAVTQAGKPITTAQLTVTDAAGPVNSAIPLSLGAASDVPDHALAFRIADVPGDAMLSTGRKTADGIWQLSREDAEHVKLVAPAGEPGNISLRIEAVDLETGDLAAPARQLNIALLPADIRIEPAAMSLPPSAMPTKAATPHDDEHIQALLERGDKLMAMGDVISARALFRKASDLGSAQAALGLARTYDPLVFAQLNVHGPSSDADMAMKLYQQARQAGADEAKKYIAALRVRTY